MTSGTRQANCSRLATVSVPCKEKKKCFRWYARTQETDLASWAEKMKRNNCRLISFQVIGYSNLEAIFLIFINPLIGYPNFILEAIKNFKKSLSPRGRKSPTNWKSRCSTNQARLCGVYWVWVGRLCWIKAKQLMPPFFMLAKPARWR
jgi:hypothetical protein